MPSPASAPPIRTTDPQSFFLKGEGYRRSQPRLLGWSKKIRIEDGDYLDFEAFPFQRELYESFGDKGLATVDVMKSAQCGISAAAVSLALYAGDVWEASVLYVLPSSDDVYDFSDTRVKPAIDGSEWLSWRVRDEVANKGLKRIGNASLYFRGSISERKALSIPADVLILDEYDRLDQKNIPKFERRLNSPKSLRLQRRFSNPSFPEAGIHKLYLDSDQREWFVRCTCRHEAAITYGPQDGTHHVDPDRELVVCGRCKKPLKMGAIAAGRWVARHPKTTKRGYHISRLNVPGEDVAAIVASHEKTAEEDVQAHFNYDLGLPYSPRGGSLDRELVLACRRDYAMPSSYHGGEWVTAGVDVGRVLHVRISRWLDSGRAVPLYIGEIDSFAELGQLWSRYGVNFGVIDERPEERAARSFMDAHRGRVLLARWSGEDQRDPIVLDDDNGLVIARRTGSCDRLVDQVTNQMKLLPRDLPARYVEQMTAPHRVVETTPRGQKVARYVSEREDHYFFAETYDLLAREARGGPAAGASGPSPTEGKVRRSRWRG